MTDRHATGIIRNGIRVDPAKQRDWQKRGAVKYAAKRQANQLQHNQARRTTKIAPSTAAPKKRNDWPPATRKLAKLRSGGVCELDGTSRATHLHHRKFRRHRDHRIQNALHVCDRCHDVIHGHGSKDASIETSVLMGWIVPANQDPAKVSVLLPNTEGRVLLDDRGHYLEAA